MATTTLLRSTRRLLLFSRLLTSPSPSPSWHNLSFPPPTHHHFFFSTTTTTTPTPTPDPPPPNPNQLDPIQIWKHLSSIPANSLPPPLPGPSLNAMSTLFRNFAKSSWATDQALALYLSSALFPSAVRRFRLFLLPRLSPELSSHLLSLPPDSAVRFLFPIFAEYCLSNFSSQLRTYEKLVEYADLTKPHTWYPFARAMRRKIIYHCGPTNSGKTHNALASFAAAKSGVYCSPLRLLAMEVFDKVNALGVYCSLLTGQEKKELPFSDHVACTIEMVSTDWLYEVAVIDEVQMMADPVRGCAWTRALLGLKADEVHLCGDPSVLNIVKKICLETGDDLDIRYYERFKPLVVEAKTLRGDLKNVRSGDCIVAFSRREIFEVKLAVERYTKHKCCVIYGALPPETRRQQASLFNEQDNEYDVLVASDAVGMGLNLNIRRVVFYSLSKYNGDKMALVSASQVKQIAGRAGRRGSVYPDGLVTTFLLDDLEYMIQCLQQPFVEAKKVGLFPCFEQVELFAGQSPNCTFNDILDKFRENCRLDGYYFLCQLDSVKKVANMLQRVEGLSLQDRYNFCFAPVNIRDPKAMYHLLRFAMHYSEKRPVGIAMGMPKGTARNDAELLDLETKHQVLSMYLWLSHQFEEDKFPYVEKAETMATNVVELLAKSLAKVRWKPESRSKGMPREQQEEEERQDDANANEPESKSVQKPKIAKNGYGRPQSLVTSFLKKRQDQQNQNSLSWNSAT